MKQPDKQTTKTKIAMMKKTAAFIALTFFSCMAVGQSNYQQFKKLFTSKDTTKIKVLLANWEKSNPNDPELYTSAFNYYFSGSEQEIISLDDKQHGEESLQLKDSTGKIAGFLNSNLGYNPDKLKMAFYYIDKGIELFPNRLDMRFGKCHVLGELNEYKDFTNEIIKTVTYSTTIKNAWLWTENKKLEDGEKNMLSSIQAYLKQLYDTEDEQLLENIKKIGDLTIKYYPNYVEILSTTAVAYMLDKNYDKALAYLKQAEKIDPKDYIVLANIAQAYKRKGDKANAIKYYELMFKYGDEEAKQEAKKFLEELRK
jgi:tetratricopeptide (TPR) repeat protein